MALSSLAMEELAKTGMIALPGAFLLIGILLLLAVLMACIVLLVLGFDLNLLMFKVFRRIGGIYLAKVFADDTINFEFRKNWDYAQNEMDFNPKGKDLTEKKPFRLDLKLSKRHRKYGTPVICIVEGQPVNSDWRLGIKENEASQLNAISKMRAHALGVLEGMLANMWDKRWLIIIAVVAIIGVAIGGINWYQASQTTTAMQGMASKVGSLVPDVMAIKSALGSTGTGIIAPGG